MFLSFLDNFKFTRMNLSIYLFTGCKIKITRPFSHIGTEGCGQDLKNYFSSWNDSISLAIGEIPNGTNISKFFEKERDVNYDFEKFS